MIDKLKSHWLIIAVVVFGYILRFNSDLPIIMADDSVKYIAPWQIVQTANFDWILSTINFSLYQRVVSYFFQLNFGDLYGVIFINKIFSLIAAYLIYSISFKISNNKYLSSAGALFYLINPQLLFLEQAIMPEASFLFFLILSVYLFYQSLNSERKAQTLYLIAFGASVIIAAHAKQTASTWIFAVLTAAFILALFKKEFLKIFLVSLVSISIFGLPMKVYNLQKFGQFKETVYNNGAGALLWGITEDMLTENPPRSYQWLTQTLLYLTKQNRKKLFNLEDGSKDLRSFYTAISDVNSSGRIGRLRHPISGKTISSKEWSTICKKYTIEIATKQPVKYIKRIVLSTYRVLFEANLNGHFYFNSKNPELEFESMPISMQPFSLTQREDPKLSKYQKVDLRTMTEDDFNVYKPKGKFNDSFFLMERRASNFAYTIKIDSLSLWLQKVLKNISFAYLWLPLFLFACFQFLKNLNYSNKEELLKNENLFKLFLIASTVFYNVLPVIVALGEPRYRMQALPFVIIFIISEMKNYKSSK